MTIDPIMGQLPLLSEDLIVLENCLLDLVGGRQDFLMIFLGIYIDPLDLRGVGSPFDFCVIHLIKWISKAKQESPTSISYLVFKLHNAGKGLEMH